MLFIENELFFQITGQLYLMRGKIYEALMNRGLAARNYKEALRHDIYCFEAFELLTQHQMLSRNEGKFNFSHLLKLSTHIVFKCLN